MAICWLKFSESATGAGLSWVFFSSLIYDWFLWLYFSCQSYGGVVGYAWSETASLPSLGVSFLLVEVKGQLGHVFPIIPEASISLFSWAALQCLSGESGSGKIVPSPKLRTGMVPFIPYCVTQSKSQSPSRYKTYINRLNILMGEAANSLCKKKKKKYCRVGWRIVILFVAYQKMLFKY